MEKIDLRNSGPFTPAEAARRVKIASRQLKWFTLCHPYWHTAHCTHQWKTTFPLPPLVIPKGVRLTCVDDVDAEFSLARPGGDELADAVGAGTKLAGVAKCSIGFYGRGGRNKPGLFSFRIVLTPGGDWDAKVSVFHPHAKDKRAAVKLAVEAGQLAAAGGWRLVPSTSPPDKKSCTESKLVLALNGKEQQRWVPVVEAILATQPTTIKKAALNVWFNNAVVHEQNWWQGSHSVWNRTDGKPSDSLGQHPERLLELLGNTGFPSGTAEVTFESTVERIEDVLALFKLAMQCGTLGQQALGIFETERGKQGFLLFDVVSKGIKLIVAYGPNGWEDLHEELRRTNGKPVFSAKQQAPSAG